MPKVYLALGSNLGDRDALLSRAIRLIGERAGQVLRSSARYETVAEGFDSDNLFLNMVIELETELTPRDLLEATQRIEQELGRQSKSQGLVYQDRPIDIDILLYGALRLETESLTIPHPRMWERSFVMHPLRDLLPDL